MTCKNCGSAIAEDARFCTVCGAKIEAEAPAVEAAPAVEPAPAPEPTYTAPVFTAPVEPVFKQSSIPEQYEPLSPWAYWGYKLLFSVPVVGFIFLIIFSCKDSNINRRNFARSHWCDLILAAIVLLILIIAIVLGGLGAAGLGATIRY